SEVTVAIENLPFSSLVSVEGSSGDRSFNYLGTQETLPVNSQNFYMIPNLALFTDAYNIEEQSYQDGFVSLYYGSGTQVGGETDYDDRIYMTYANTQVDDYDSIITSGVPTSWEESFNITNQFLTTQDITVSGTALYHQLFDMTNDVIDNDDLVSILGNISGVYFGVKIPDEVNIAHIRAIGTPYEYDLSVQGFPIGDYVDGTYSNVVTEGFTQEFDGRSITELLNSTTDFSLEFASNGSKYIVFYQPLSAITQNYAQNNKLMVDYWSYHTFMEGFDYKIQEDPNDPFVSIINWTYYIEDLTTYTMHPDFSVDTSFFIEFSALSWSSANNDYIKDVQDKFTFRPVIKSNISVFYYGDDNESFSILNIVPQDQFNDSSIYKDLYIEIWQVGDPSTIELFNINLDPIIFDYIFQDENVSFYYWVNFTKIQEDLDTMRSGYTIVDDSYTYIEVNFISSRLIYELAQTPFNYDYLGAAHNSYHIKLTVEGQSPIYSYDTTEFNKFVEKIEDNYIYFNDKVFGEEGYIENKTQITIDFKAKLQPGLLDREHFSMVIYPWKHYFDVELSSITGPINYRDGYRKLSSSSIIAPFEYSLSINDTYSL
ncbi:hypothetical protein LCGC14_2253630, partial [marine sediment metagenome]